MEAERFNVRSNKWEDLKIVLLVRIRLAAGMPPNRESCYQLGLETGGRISTFSYSWGSLSLSVFHLVFSQAVCCTLKSWLRNSSNCKPAQNLYGKGVKKMRGQSILGCGGRVENSMAEGVIYWGFFPCNQLEAFSGHFLLPLGAVFSLPFSHPAKLSSHPSTYLHPHHLSRGALCYPFASSLYWAMATADIAWAWSWPPLNSRDGVSKQILNAWLEMTKLPCRTTALVCNENYYVYQVPWISSSYLEV